MTSEWSIGTVRRFARDLAEGHGLRPLADGRYHVAELAGGDQVRPGIAQAGRQEPIDY